MSKLEDVALARDVGSIVFSIDKKRYKAQYPDYFIWDFENQEILMDLKKLDMIYKHLDSFSKSNSYLIIRVKKIKEKIDEIKLKKSINKKEFKLYYYCKLKKEKYLGKTFALDINEAIFTLIKRNKLDYKFNKKDFLIDGNQIFEK